MSEILLRPAEPSEATLLTALTRRSKGHWGYDEAILDRMAEILSISAETIQHGHVVVIERDGVVVGYYQLAGDPPHGELADLFLDPDVIGTGLGRVLWAHAVDAAVEAGFQSLSWESDPQAEPFYRHMGAERIGEREVAPGRVLPRLRADLTG